MTIWDGFAPVGASPYSIRDLADDRSSGWVNADGSAIEWWNTDETGGVTFTPTGCVGARCEEVSACEECECDPFDCEHEASPCDSVPNAVRFDPFWIYTKRECDPAGRDPNQLYQQLRQELDALAWIQIARRFHQALQDNATDITGASPSTPSEGLGALLRARGTLGLPSGVLVVPSLALPILQSSGLVSSGSGPLTGPGGIQVIADPGIAITGPAGATPAPGSAYIYILSHPPVIAIRNEYEPGGANWDFNNPRDRKLFFDDECACNDCFHPKLRKRGIVAINPCAAFGIAIDVRDCSCPDALPAPEPAAEGEGK